MARMARWSDLSIVKFGSMLCMKIAGPVPYEDNAAMSP